MYEFAPGSTGKSIYFLLRDAASAQPKPGLSVASPGALASYTRQGGSATPITLVALAGPTSAWTAGGFAEVDPAIQPGVYRLDLPDAALSAGVPYVIGCLAFNNAIGEGALVLLRNPTNNVGPGAISWTVTVERSDNSQPIAGALVWVSTDIGGANVVAGALTTNAFGQVTFLLNAGPYYLWVQDSGFTGTNPTLITVA